MLFGIQFGPVPQDDSYFDTTTIALFRKVASKISADARVVDMGTGCMGVIGISLWKRVGCQVVCSDNDERAVAGARTNVMLNSAPIEVVTSRFFERLGDDFDTVVFNPPYVGSNTGRRRQLSTRPGQWDGGERGTAVIDAYLGDLVTVRQPVITYLGVNSHHVPRDVMLDLIANGPPDCSVIDIWSHRWLPTDVYTISKPMLSGTEGYDRYQRGVP